MSIKPFEGLKEIIEKKNYVPLTTEDNMSARAGSKSGGDSSKQPKARRESSLKDLLSGLTLSKPMPSASPKKDKESDPTLKQRSKSISLMKS